MPKIKLTVQKMFILDKPGIMSDVDIKQALNNRLIVIDPFVREDLSVCSYDLHLGRYLTTFTEGLASWKKVDGTWKTVYEDVQFSTHDLLNQGKKNSGKGSLS
jgi:hypothetical protein